MSLPFYSAADDPGPSFAALLSKEGLQPRYEVSSPYDAASITHGHLNGIERWPEIAMARANGSLVEIKARTWSDDLPARLAAHGLQVQRADPMALEDIFVTAVRSGGVA